MPLDGDGQPTGGVLAVGFDHDHLHKPQKFLSIMVKHEEKYTKL